MKKNKFLLMIFMLFIIVALLIRLFGVFIGNFENNAFKNSYFTYKKIANNEISDEIQSIIIIPNQKIEIKKIFKKPIGIIKTTEEKNIIDSSGKLFKASQNMENQLITVEGHYKLWPQYYEKLEKYGLLDEVYQVAIYSYRIDIWLYPGILVQLGEQIEDLRDFKKAYPSFFTKGTLIDLRDTKRVGISKFKTSKN